MVDSFTVLGIPQKSDRSKFHSETCVWGSIPPGLVAQCLSMVFMPESMGRFHSRDSMRVFDLENIHLQNMYPLAVFQWWPKQITDLLSFFSCECKEKGKEWLKHVLFLLKKWNRDSKCASLSASCGWCGGVCLVNRIKGKTPYLYQSSFCKKTKHASLVFMFHAQDC